MLVKISNSDLFFFFFSLELVQQSVAGGSFSAFYIRAGMEGLFPLQGKRGLFGVIEKMPFLHFHMGK